MKPRLVISGGSDRFGKHRQKNIEGYYDDSEVDKDPSIDGCQRGVYLVEGQWLIGPVFPHHENAVPDIGPFDTPELAWSTLQLLKD
jgi:hypothetical protein